MYMYLAECTGTDKSMYLTPCETDMDFSSLVLSHLWNLVTSGSHWIKHMDAIWLREDLTHRHGRPDIPDAPHSTETGPSCSRVTDSWCSVCPLQTTTNDDHVCLAEFLILCTRSLDAEKNLCYSVTQHTKMIGRKPLLKNYHCCPVNAAIVYTTM